MLAEEVIAAGDTVSLVRVPKVENRWSGRSKKRITILMLASERDV